MKRILLLTDVIAPYRIPVFNRIAKDETLDFTALSLTRNMLGREWRFDGKKVKFKFRTLNGLQVPGLLPGKMPLVVNLDLSGALRDIDPEAIIIMGYHQPAFLKTLLYARKKGLRVICWVESTLRTVRIKNALSYRYRRWFLGMCDAFIVPGIRSKEFLLTLKIKEDRIFIAPNAGDNDSYYTDFKNKYFDRKNMLKSRGYPEKNFLYVGRIMKEKGLEALFRAYKDANLGDNIGLILVGSGGDERYFRKLSEKLKLKNVFFEGFKQTEELKSYYSLADIFVFPSLRDEWGMVLNEAAASGLPIITSDEPTASDTLVSDKNGWKFRKNDITTLSSCLGNILLPEEELIKRGIESQKTASRHSPKECAASIIEAVKKTLKQKKVTLSSSGISYGRDIRYALYDYALLYNVFRPGMLRIFLKVIIKIASKYKNTSSVFIQWQGNLFDKHVSAKLKKAKVDIFHGFSGSSLYSLLEAKKKNAICIVDQHDLYYKVVDGIIAEELRLDPAGISSISYWPPIRKYHVRIDEELKIADYIFVPSTFSLKTHIENGIPKEKLVLMPLGIWSDSIGKSVKPKKEKGFRVGFIGSISLRKGVKYLLSAIKEINKPDIKAYLAGSFSAKSGLLKGYKGCYELMGYLRKNKKSDFISGLDVVVFPSISDALGLVILEAMAKGVPVIATENTGARDVIDDGKDGFIVPVRNVKAIKEKILFLYNNNEEKIAMGERALKKVPNFTWEKYAQRYKDFIEKI